MVNRSSLNPVNLPQPLPRKGTETAGVGAGLVYTGFAICHNLYPARGRKPMPLFFKDTNFSDLPQPLPRKGTETALR